MSEKTRAVVFEWFNPGTWIVGLTISRPAGYRIDVAVHLGPLVSIFIGWPIKEGSGV
jgi:hypothetical protein